MSERDWKLEQLVKMWREAADKRDSDKRVFAMATCETLRLCADQLEEVTNDQPTLP